MRDVRPEENTVYEKPAVIHRELIESIAGICDTQDPVNGKTGTADECTVINS